MKMLSKYASLGLILMTMLCTSMNVYADRLPIITNANTGVVYDNLQTAINAATAGQTLKVKGTAVGNFIINKNLIILGAHDATLDGGLTGTVVTVSSTSAQVNLNRFKIKNGLGQSAGGILNVGNLTVSNSEITENASLSTGGGITNSTGGHLTLIKTKVSHNSAITNGGGLLSIAGTVFISDCKFSNNEAEGTGGGAILIATTSTINDSEFENNRSPFGAGGGIALSTVSNVTINNTHITSNNGGQGGGLFNAGSTLVVNESLVHKNVSLTTGGGLQNSTAANTTFNDSEIRHNNAATSGGGIFNVAGATLILRDTRVHDNTPDNIVDL